jgi:hypothetical protein
MSDVPNQTEETVVEISQEPETQTETPQTEPKTKTRLFRERLEQYADRETAKAHIKEIAKDLQCKNALGYKALKDIVFPNEQGQPPPAQEPTARIPEQTPEPFPETPTEQPAEAQVTQVTEVTEQPLEAPAHVAISPTVAKLEPILERSVKRLFNSIIEQISGAQETLTDQESRDTAILLPIMVFRLTKVNLSEDQFIDMTCVTHFGSIILKVVAPKLKALLRPKPEAPEPKRKPKPEPAPEPDKQTTLTPEPPTPAEPAETPAQEKPNGKKLLAKLPA